MSSKSFCYRIETATHCFKYSYAGFLPGFSQGGGARSIVMQMSFVMLNFLLFSDQISGDKSLRVGANCLRGAPPPPVEESQYDFDRKDKKVADYKLKMTRKIEERIQ